MEPTKSNIALASAIAKYPSLKAFAGELDVPYQTVQQWFKNGVPAEYCPQIEKLSGGAALCEDLNSRVDWTYLRSNPIPPKTAKRQSPRSPRKAPTLPP